MTTPTPAQQSIFTLIEGTAGVPVVFAWENGPRPPKPYIAMLVNTAARGHVHRGTVSNAGVQTVAQHRDARVDLQCYGAGSYDVLDTLAQRLHMLDALDLADVLDLAVFDVGSTQNVPMMRDAMNWEPRAILDLGIRYTSTLDDQVGAIETVEAEGTTTGGALAPDEESTIDLVITAPTLTGAGAS